MAGQLSLYQSVLYALRMLPEMRTDVHSVESHLDVAQRCFLDVPDQALQSIVDGYSPHPLSCVSTHPRVHIYSVCGVKVLG